MAELATVPETPEVQEKKEFRLRNKKIFLTYKTHLDKKAVEKFLSEKWPTAEVIVAHETGTANPDLPYEHTHILVRYLSAISTSRQDYFDFEGIHPHIKPVGSEQEYKQKKHVYICKEDPELSHLKEGPVNLVSKVWKSATVQDALTENVSRFSDVPGILACYRHRPVSLSITISLRPWQEHLTSVLEQKPDPCKILWVWDQVGGQGKTTMCKHLLTLSGNNYYVLRTSGGRKDFGTLVKTAIDSGWTGHCIIFDLPRSAVTDEIYEPLEQVKDGLITATKYQGGTIIIPTPHVVVFANFLPEVGRLSAYKWELLKLQDGHITPLNIMGRGDEGNAGLATGDGPLAGPALLALPRLRLPPRQ